MCKTPEELGRNTRAGKKRKNSFTNFFGVLLIISIIINFIGLINATESDHRIGFKGESPSSTELKAIMINSSKNLSSYTYTTNILQTIEMLSKNSKNRSELIISSSTNGSINLTGRSLEITSKIYQISGGKNVTSNENEMILKDGVLFQKQEDHWTGFRPSNIDTILHSANILRNRANSLNESNMTLLGFENISGDDCYWTKVEPNADAFAAIVTGQFGSSFPAFDLNSTKKLYSKAQLKWTSWIARDAHFLKKNEIRISFTVPSEMLGITKNENTNEIKINLNITTLCKDFNQNILITPSNDFKSAYPFPIKSDNGITKVTVFGILQEDDGTNIYVDMAATEDVTANLVDIDDRFYQGEYHANANERTFLQFQIPPGTIIKKLRFEPYYDYDHSKGSPFSSDVRLDHLGSVITAPRVFKEASISENGITLTLYNLTSKNNYYSDNYYYKQNAAHSEDLASDIKITNNGSEELQLIPRDFSFIDQFGWEYAIDIDQSSNKLGTLLPGESRRFNLIIKQVSVLSDLRILKFRNIMLYLR